MTISKDIQNNFIMDLRKTLNEITKIEWEIEAKRGLLGETIADKEKDEDENDKRNVSELPLVRAILSEFSDAKITNAIRKKLENEKIEIEEEEFIINDEY